MKKILVGAITCLQAALGLAQTSSSGAPSFNSLQINSAPAFTILGVAPSNIQKPTTPKAFASNAENTINNGKLSPNFALEATPYYLFHMNDSARFSPTDFLLPNQDWVRMVAKNFSVSVGTSNSDTATFGKLQGTGLGVGVHTLLVQGKPKKEIAEQLIEYNKSSIRGDFLDYVHLYLLHPDRDARTAINRAYGEYIKKLNFLVYDQKLSYNSCKETVGQMTDSLLKVLSAGPLDLNKMTDDITQYNTNRNTALKALNSSSLPFAPTGFTLSLDAAEATVFQGGNLNSSYYAKTAVWLTPAYSWQLGNDVKLDGDNNNTKSKVSLLSMMAVARYTFNNIKAGVDTGNYVDVGLKVEYGFSSISVSLEGVERWATRIPSTSDKNNTYLWAATFKWKISDNLTLNVAYGANFNGTTTTYTNPKNIVGLAGLNLGMFK